MRNLCTTLPALILVAVLAGCTSPSALEHQSQSAPDTNLSAYRTFGWKAPAGGTTDEPMRILDANIRTAIRAELTRRGYVETETNPQLLIVYDTAAGERVKSNPFRIGIGLGSFGSNGGGSVNVGSPSVQSYREGRLVIHVLDAAENREVWLGTITGRDDNKTPDADSVARTVALAMQDFPARAAAP